MGCHTFPLCNTHTSTKLPNGAYGSYLAQLPDIYNTDSGCQNPSLLINCFLPFFSSFLMLISPPYIHFKNLIPHVLEFHLLLSVKCKGATGCLLSSQWSAMDAIGVF